ncbi:uncharacterized protein FA14DRAFT_37673 [Meira miltonrushii]|uniref:Uncharacterized protein n=1 Tax=Meira miltonrushii TaxID=1280837 RepID=A0A316VCS1_9BASI|nr:uncharacterized protein FA14DRAFT_37673 [Meira miltonrushii]PWN35104.1 hypothetical protein FA14DRAFT_37673 [Meira miltonrushii]
MHEIRVIVMINLLFSFTHIFVSPLYLTINPNCGEGDHIKNKISDLLLLSTFIFSPFRYFLTVCTDTFSHFHLPASSQIIYAAQSGFRENAKIVGKLI